MVFLAGGDVDKRALAATGRTDERDDLSVGYVELDAVQNGPAEIGVGDAFERKGCHLLTPHGRAASRQRSSSARMGCTTPYSTMKIAVTITTTQAID